ncbi:hypothetical protein H1Z61_15155 [Bacillus aquiflavi]|uniref:Uncharacterized protein n=1 Tax=Bacillus aquiflavi TaxID=2672567 RepID=A0A6B3W2U3_9BACI|nr:hypothetical protein [Bacillus aquiflavi]MBA4538433.1 hypothetical protein [Bacillus aquiflavi]NEY82797.1 hypothetical protein [Bacillus aquiflavi]
MAAFKGLIIKEFKITQYFFITYMILLVAAIVGGYSFTNYIDEPKLFSIGMLLMILAHFFYLPLYLLTSLNIEGRTQLWLHNPNSVLKLICAKLIPGLIFQLISLSLSILIAIILIKQFNFFIEDFLIINILMFVSIFLGSIYVSIWVLFYWTLNYALSRILHIKSFRWLFIIFIWATITTLATYIRSHSLYKKIISLGEIKLNIIPFEMKSNTDYGFYEIFIHVPQEFSFIPFLLYIMTALLIFFVSAWMLERKVEV